MSSQNAKPAAFTQSRLRMPPSSSRDPGALGAHRPFCAAIGLHPELVVSHAHELPDLLRMIDQTRYVGEVGLDYVTPDVTLRRKQRRVFEAILKRSAELGDRVLTVHSRRRLPTS